MKNKPTQVYSKQFHVTHYGHEHLIFSVRCNTCRTYFHDIWI